MQDPLQLFPYVAQEVAAERRRIADEDAYAEGNHSGNGDCFPDACFTKALPHDANGVVSKRAWRKMVAAIESRDPRAWAEVPMGSSSSGAKLVNPTASLSFDLDGPAPCSVGIPPAPKLSSAEAAAEMVELYEQCAARDIPFRQYKTHLRLRPVVERLSRMSGYVGPTSKDGAVATSVLFRGGSAGDLSGPYLSQFLILPYEIVGTRHEQMYRFPVSRKDHMKEWKTALSCQNGKVLEPAPRIEKRARYISTGRDLAWYAHEECSVAPHMHPLLVMRRLDVPFAPGNPFASGRVGNQVGSLCLGMTDAIDALTRAASCALKAAWYHKWLVHQRLRPEAMGMLIDMILQTDENPYKIHRDLIDSKTMAEVYKRNKNLLLPQVYPEGAPCSPSYPSGHAAVAGALVTILKAFFDERWTFDRAYEPSDDGSELVEVRCSGELTVGGELDKLASNIAMGRAFAGVHYRSDGVAGIELGERVAVRLLKELVQRYPEDDVVFKFHLRDGTKVVVRK